VAARELPDRVHDPAEQGDRRRQRVRPPVRDPPGPRHQEPADEQDTNAPTRAAGHDPAGEPLDVIYRQAIALADSKKEVTDADLLALVEQRASEVPASVELLGWNVTSSHGGNATGSVSLNVKGEDRAAAAARNGPVDALYSAVD